MFVFSFVQDGSMFIKLLSLGSVQCMGVIDDALLPPLSSNLEPPQPSKYTTADGKVKQYCATLSAGNFKSR